MRKAAGVAYLAVLALGIALRAVGLTSWDMWTDEINTLWTSQTGNYASGPMYRSAPINFVLTGWAIRLFGPHELGARIVPFLCGVATLALFFPLWKRRIGTRAALLGSLVLALSVWHIYWSQTARHFALQTLFILLALEAFLRFWSDGRRGGSWAAAALLLAAMFSHSSGGFYLAALLAFVAGWWLLARLRGGLAAPWGEDDRRALSALLPLALALAVYLPVYVVVGLYTLEHRVAWNPPWNIVGSLVFYVPPALAAPALGGALFLRKERSDLGGLLLTCIAIPMVLVTAASAVTIASGSYCLASMLPIAVLAGVAGDRLLEAFPDRPGRVAAGLVVAGIFAALAYDAALYHTYAHGLKPRWKELCADVEARLGPGEILLADEGDVAQYYLGMERADWFAKHEPAMGTPAFPPEGVAGVWYGIYLTDSPILQKGEGTLGYILRGGTLVKTYPLHYGPKDRTLALFHQVFGEPARP